MSHSNSDAVLRSRFSPANYGLDEVDFDAALLRESEVRALTRSVARWLYDQEDSQSGTPLVDGIEFRSRHGDDLRAWATFERVADGPSSTRLANIEVEELTPETPALRAALELHGLQLH